MMFTILYNMDRSIDYFHEEKQAVGKCGLIPPNLLMAPLPLSFPLTTAIATHPALNASFEAIVVEMQLKIGSLLPFKSETKCPKYGNRQRKNYDITQQPTLATLLFTQNS